MLCFDRNKVNLKNQLVTNFVHYEDVGDNLMHTDFVSPNDSEIIRTLTWRTETKIDTLLATLLLQVRELKIGPKRLSCFDEKGNTSDTRV